MLLPFLQKLVPWSGASHFQPLEQTLWSALDTCGIDFRSPLHSLTEGGAGFPSPWCRTSHTAPLPATKPLIKGQEMPPLVEYSADADLDAPPEKLCLSIAQDPDHRLNYAKTIHALVKLFGDGSIQSAPDRVSRHWQFGYGSMRCTVALADTDYWQNTPPPDRAKARIEIWPAFCPKLSTQETSWLANADHIGPFDPAPKPIFDAILRRRASANAVPTGLYLTHDNAALICATDRLLYILPRDRVTALHIDYADPKTPQNTRLLISYRLQTSEGSATRALQLSLTPTPKLITQLEDRLSLHASQVQVNDRTSP